MDFPESVKKGLIFKIRFEFISYSLPEAGGNSVIQANKDAPYNEVHP